MGFFSKRSKIVLVYTVLSTIFMFVLASVVLGAFNNDMSNAEEIGTQLGGLIMGPHLVFVVLAVIFAWLCVGLKANWAILTSSILMCVAAVLMPTNLMFTIPLAVLGFVGFAFQRKITEKPAEAPVPQTPESSGPPLA